MTHLLFYRLEPFSVRKKNAVVNTKKILNKITIQRVVSGDILLLISKIFYYNSTLGGNLNF